MLPDRGFFAWLFETWQALESGGVLVMDARRLERRPTVRALVTPTPFDFPVDTNLRGHALVEDYLLFVAEHAGVSEWPLEPVPLHTLLDTDSDAIALGDEERTLPVPYELSELREPPRLIAQLVRGVTQAWLAANETRAAQPWEESELEAVTDVATVFLGFGIFTADAARRAHARAPLPVGGDPGVRLPSWGEPTMAEHEIACAIALHGILAEVPDREIERYLGGNARSFHRRAVKHLLRHHGPALARLRGARASRRGPYR